MNEIEERKQNVEPKTAKPLYERAAIEEHEPLEEATAYIYYYYLF